MNEDLPKHPINLLPLPPEGDRKRALDERRNNARDLAKAAMSIMKLKEETQKDTLTGLPNRLAFNEKLPEIFEVAKKGGSSLALMLLDIDGMKRTNESLGHPMGDKLLQTVAKTFITNPDQEKNSSILRPDDIVGRFDGDEYWAILPNYQPMDNQTVDELNESKIKTIQANFLKNAHELGIPDDLHVGITIGIAVIQPNDNIESFIERADKQLRDNKEEKKVILEKEGIIFEDDRLSI